MGNLQPEPYVPMRDWHTADRAPDAAPPLALRTSSTSQSYTLALLPAVHVFLLITITVVRNGETTWPIIGATNLAMMMIGVLVARGDQRRLITLGLRERTSAWLGLLSPLVYLLLRGNRAYRQTHTGLRPFWLCVLVTVASAGAVVLAPTMGHFLGRPIVL